MGGRRACHGGRCSNPWWGNGGGWVGCVQYSLVGKIQLHHLGIAVAALRAALLCPRRARSVDQSTAHERPCRASSKIKLFPPQERFRSNLLAQSEEFKKQVANLMEEFTTKGPFTSNIATDEALKSIEAIRGQLNALKEQEQQLRRGLGIFKIDQPPSKEIAALEKVACSCSFVFFVSLCNFLFVFVCFLGQSVKKRKRSKRLAVVALCLDLETVNPPENWGEKKEFFYVEKNMFAFSHVIKLCSELYLCNVALRDKVFYLCNNAPRHLISSIRKKESIDIIFVNHLSGNKMP